MMVSKSPLRWVWERTIQVDIAKSVLSRHYTPPRNAAERFSKLLLAPLFISRYKIFTDAARDRR